MNKKIKMPKIIPPNGWKIVKCPEYATIYQDINGNWILQSEPVIFAENVLTEDNRG